MTVSSIPAFTIDLEQDSKSFKYPVVITFTDSLEEISGTFNSSSDEFIVSWFSSKEAEDLYDSYWEELEDAVINDFYS